MVNSNEYALEVVDVKKSFFENKVLLGVSFGLRHGEILGLLGANGAGKSTLMKIVNGIYKMDSGCIRINGKEVQIKESSDAKQNHIAMVYQEFSLIPTMTVVQNLFLGREPKKHGLIDEDLCHKQALEIFEKLGIEIDPDAVVGALSIGNQQLVEIAKAMMQEPAVLILDEPTASLTHSEIGLLFDFIDRLRKNGIAIILITHHMQEIMEICNRAVILRGGLVEMDSNVKDVTIQDMVEAMVGRAVSGEIIPPEKPIDYSEQPLLEVKNISWKNKVNDISFSLYPREVVGVAGLLGSGRTELLKNIYGLVQPDSGEIYLAGKQVPPRHNPAWSIDHGICFVPENRRVNGIIPIHSINMNMMISIWNKYRRHGLLDDKKAIADTRDMISKLDVACTGPGQALQSLSGGNQQKVVFGKSIFTNPKVLLLDDPTVGIDVDAKTQVASIIRGVADQGSAVLLVSSEVEYLETVCDRVIILRDGQIHKIMRAGVDDLSEASIIATMQN